MKSLKITGSHGRTETLVWNRCSYQVPEMVRTDAITNKKDKFYNSMVHTIIKGEVLLITKAPLLISFMDLSLQSGSLQFNYTTPEYKPILKKKIYQGLIETKTITRPVIRTLIPSKEITDQKTVVGKQIYL